MLNKEYISLKQLQYMIIGFLLGTSLIFSFGIAEAKRDAWISQVIAFFVGVLVVFGVAYIAKKFPDNNIEELLGNLLGKKVYKIVVLYFCFYSYILSIFILNNIATFMNTMIMQETPIWIFILTMSITTAYIVRKGIEVIARCVEIIMPITIIILILLLIILLSTSFNINNLRPALATNLRNIIKPAITISIFPYCECILLLFINCLTIEKEKLIKNNLLAIGVAGFFLVLRPIVVIGTYGVKQAETLAYPVFFSMRTIKSGEFFNRIELFMLVIWFLTAFVKLAISMYVTSKSTEIIFSLKDYKQIIISMSIFMVPLAYRAYTNYDELKSFVTIAWFLLTSILIIIFIVIFIKAVFAKSNDVSLKNN